MWLTTPDGARRFQVTTTGAYAYGGYPDIDGLFREQATEHDPKKREATLRRIQQLIHDKSMVLPIWQLAMIQAYGPGVAESGLGLVADYPWSELAAPASSWSPAASSLWPPNCWRIADSN